MNVAIYARISLDRDGDAGAINRRQLPDCQTFASTHSHTVLDTLTDNDISASKSKPRPAYQRLFDLARSSTIDAVIVWHLDRLYRKPRELEDLIDQVESTNLRILTVTGGDYDLNTSDGRAYARIIVALACKESEDKVRRLKRKAQELAERGLPTGRMGYGYNQDLTINEDEALIIKQCTARILAGDPIYAVCRDLDAAGVPTPSASRRHDSAQAARSWGITSLRGVLTAGRIAGLREAHVAPGLTRAVTAPAAWLAIITEDELTCLRAILWSRSRPATSRSYLLSGLLVCSLCNTKLASRPQGYSRGRVVRRYHCVSSHGGCNRLGIDASKAEAFVSELVLKRLGNVKPRRQDLALTRKVQADEKRLTTLAQKRFVDETITDLEYQAARVAIVERLELHRQKLHVQTQAQLLPLDATDIRHAWPSLTFDRQRAVLIRLIDRITVAAARPGSRFDAERLSAVSWKV